MKDPPTPRGRHPGSNVPAMATGRWSTQVRYPKLHDREWLRQRYLVEDAGLKAIADELGCTTAAVLRALGQVGIDIKGGRGPARRWDPTRDELIEEYTDAGSLDELARRRGMSKATIRNIFGRRHLRPSDIPLAGREYPQLADKEWLERALYEKNVSDVAEEIGCREETVRRAAQRFGIGVTRGAPHALRDRAIALYEAGNTLHVVSRIVRRDQSQVYRWLKAAGVDTTQRR